MSILVADLSHHNWDNGMNPDFAAAKAAGLAGIIAKASQGSAYRDPRYAQTRALAADAGLLWGAYHFCTAARAKDQLSNFIAAAHPDEATMVCLDFERNEQDPGSSIGLETALEFLDRLAQRIGRQPRLYTGPYMYDLFGDTPQPALSPYQVWWAGYASAAELHPTWREYWLWQYTDGHSGPKPHQFAGIGYCDLNRFEGTYADLASGWAA